MSPRRTLSALGLGFVAAGLIAACLPWTVEAPGVARFVGRGLQESWGVSLSAGGATEIVLLPLPRITFADVRLTEGAPSGPVLATGGRLALQLDTAALLTGRVAVESLILDGAEIRLPENADDTRWSTAAERLAGGLAENGAHPRRLVLTRATVTGRDPRDGTRQTARDVELTVAWRTNLAFSGGLTWNGARMQFALSELQPRALVAGQTSPFSAHLSWPVGSFTAEGSGSLGEDGLKAIGSGALRIRSLARTLAWIGGDVALAPLAEDLTVEGAFEAASREVQFPRVRVTTGGNVLEGAGSADFGPGRNAVQATLAADNLNLSPLLAGLMRLTGFDNGADPQAWRAQSIALAPLTSGDLDLRISAANARIGPLPIADLACGVMVRESGIEASLGRASVRGGTVKGRVVLVSDEGDRATTRVKAQGQVEGVDLGALMSDLGGDPWVQGATRGSLVLEGTGRDAGSLAGSVAGRVALRSEDGAITGLDLADMLQRSGAVTQGTLARRNGRTPYEHAALSLLFSDGIGEVVEGSFAGRGLTASLSGRLDLARRRVEAQAEVAPRAGTEGAARNAASFALTGPWDAVSVGPAMLARAAENADRFRRPGADLPLGIRAYAPATAQ
ncbi:cell envelope biogenesis protein AsmA [Methylobacterium sp. Leaf456]|uniref:AsmA family protein n=1 Tax=Methylobacterium sp. Leaf456 TaxID=1736382 RepID=UPI0006F7A9CB|nr:AsmA-like C-terminal region-containing protein [Methylobacterium sp. Leaf456]KQT57126.1 cell envelope biogenesis protein AsmA [Methylobacterium sp. Leaf456]